MPLFRFGSQPHFDLECALVKRSERFESCLGQVDMLGALGAAGTSVDNAHKYAFPAIIAKLDKLEAFRAIRPPLERDCACERFVGRSPDGLLPAAWVLEIVACVPSDFHLLDLADALQCRINDVLNRPTNAVLPLGLPGTPLKPAAGRYISGAGTLSVFVREV